MSNYNNFTANSLESHDLNAHELSNDSPSPTPRYKRVQGGNSWASAMFRFNADSFTYAARLIDNLDRFHFNSRGDLTSVLRTASAPVEAQAPTEAPIANSPQSSTPNPAQQPTAPQTLIFYCRGIEIAVFTEDDIEIKRATAAYAFDDHLIEKLRAFGIPEAFKIPLHREKEQSQKK